MIKNGLRLVLNGPPSLNLLNLFRALSFNQLVYLNPLPKISKKKFLGSKAITKFRTKGEIFFNGMRYEIIF